MRKFMIFFVLLFVVSCGGGVQYQDAKKASGSMEWGPREIKTTVDKMVTSLYGFLKNDWGKPAFIQVMNVRNRTSEHIDTSLIMSEIQTKLIQKRIKFIDDSLDAETMREIEKGMTGLIDPDSAIPVGQLKSPNFFLTGEIRENVRVVKGRRVQYLQITLQLNNTRTRVVEWQDQQEFLKSTKTDRISF